jgi:lipoyl-dependent peroxiredoxin
MAIKKIYTAIATSVGGRGGGTASTHDKQFVDLVLAHPKEMGGTGKGANPEQLFALGYAACFLGSLKYVNSNSKKPFTLQKETSVTAHVSFGPRSDKKGFGIAVQLDVSVPGLTKAQVASLAKKTHVVCAYSHAIQKNVKVTTKIV